MLEAHTHISESRINIVFISESCINIVFISESRIINNIEYIINIQRCTIYKE